MSPGLFLLGMLVVFAYLVVRSIRAGYGRLLAGIVLAPVGLAVLCSLIQVHGLLHITIATVVCLVLLGAPLWWLVRWLIATSRGV